MEFAFASGFDSGNLASVRRTERPEYVTSKEIAYYPPFPAYFFEIEGRFDNDASTFRSYFNFLVKPVAPQQGTSLVSFDSFKALQRVNFEPSVLVFTWNNPPNPKRLASNLFRATYRFFTEQPRRAYYQNPDVHDYVMAEMREMDERLVYMNDYLPDYSQVFFQTTRPAKLVSETPPRVAFVVVVNQPETSQTLQLSYCCPYCLSHIYYRFCSFKCLTSAFPLPIAVTQTRLCSSLLGFPLLMYQFCLNSKKKPVCMLTARVHPGETLSSYVLDGFVLAVLSQKIPLLEHFDLCIVPCLNVDGCYLGNYRSDSLSQNLNRAYDETDVSKYPINIALCDAIRRIRPRVLIDLHNHASIPSAVIFGNDILTDFKQRNVENLRPAAIEQTLNLYFCKLMTRLEFVNSAKCDFSYSRMDSEDGRGEGFDGTLRVVAHRELGVRFAYTIETHYFCYESSGSKRFWFLREFSRVGESIAQSLCDMNCCQHLKHFIDKIVIFLPCGFELKRWFAKGQKFAENELVQQWENGLPEQ